MFLRRIDIGKKETDGDGLDPRSFGQVPRGLHDSVFIEFIDDAAFVVEPSPHTGDATARHKRRRARVLKVVHMRVRNVGPADEKDIAKSLVGDDADLVSRFSELL